MDLTKLPQHVAIIMDGNGRWAQARRLPRTHGHMEGVLRVEEIIKAARRIGIKVLTLYTFSSENWLRPEMEVSMLLKTFMSVLSQKVKLLQKINVRVQFIGRREEIPAEVLKSMDEAVVATADRIGMTLNIAFNYGGRQEIVDAIKVICGRIGDGQLSINDLKPPMIGDFLYTKGLPDPDLLIRTSGEKRISNFLLWQLSYAEFYFTEKCWPEFTEAEFIKAIEDFQARDRRFGSVSAGKS